VIIASFGSRSLIIATRFGIPMGTSLRSFLRSSAQVVLSSFSRPNHGES
jgi:hypothetical protein